MRLDSNPLPSVIQLLPKNVLESNEDIEKLMAEIKQLPQVDFVQVDMQWVSRVQTIMRIAGRGVWLVSLLLGFAVTFITGNTIRLELQNRQDEVFISKLVGATHSFIQTAFFVYRFLVGIDCRFSGLGDYYRYAVNSGNSGGKIIGAL